MDSKKEYLDLYQLINNLNKITYSKIRGLLILKILFLLKINIQKFII
jgi:hypothetical protein